MLKIHRCVHNQGFVIIQFHSAGLQARDFSLVAHRPQLSGGCEMTSVQRGVAKFRGSRSLMRLWGWSSATADRVASI